MIDAGAPAPSPDDDAAFWGMLNKPSMNIPDRRKKIAQVAPEPEGPLAPAPSASSLGTPRAGWVYQRTADGGFKKVRVGPRPNPLKRAATTINATTKVATRVTERTKTIFLGERLGEPPPQSGADVIMRTMLELQLQKELKELGWRSDREFRIRQCIAWTFNVTVLIIALYYSFILAIRFGEIQTFTFVLGWMISYGWTFAIVEPVQVLLLACCPCMWNEDHACGRCMQRIRFVYNELFSP